jgi:hypothetical protein
VSLKEGSRTDAVAQTKPVIGALGAPLIGAQGSLVHTLPGEPNLAGSFTTIANLVALSATQQLARLCAAQRPHRDASDGRSSLANAASIHFRTRRAGDNDAVADLICELDIGRGRRQSSRESVGPQADMRMPKITVIADPARYAFNSPANKKNLSEQKPRDLLS